MANLTTNSDDKVLCEAAKSVITVLKNERKLEFCPKYFEEPCWISNRDEFDTHISGLCLTFQQRRSLLKKIKGLSIFVNTESYA